MCADDGVLATQHPAVIYLLGSEVKLKLVQHLFEVEAGRLLAMFFSFHWTRSINFSSLTVNWQATAAQQWPAFHRRRDQITSLTVLVTSVPR